MVGSKNFEKNLFYQSRYTFPNLKSMKRKMSFFKKEYLEKILRSTYAFDDKAFNVIEIII